MRLGILAGVMLVSLAPLPAIAEMTIEKMQAASGLATIISNAEHCGFSIDETALENYYLKAGLAEPDALSYISTKLKFAERQEKPSKSVCTMSRTTARSIGILAD